MKWMVYLLTAGCLSLAAWGQRTLDSSEVNALLEELTQSPRTSWLPAGTIRGKYLEYRADEDLLVESMELFRFDGDRFYWEIELLDGPNDAPPAAIQGRRMDQQSNRHRIFSYDGNAYTRYYKSADYAVVVLDQNEMSSQLFGPFSAGVIPWGQGIFTQQHLTAAQPTAIAFTEDGLPRIELSFVLGAGPLPKITMQLDPARDLAVCSYIFDTPVASIQQHYRNYQYVGGAWVPFIITIERFDLGSDGSTLDSYEDWRFETVNPHTPADGFSVSFSNGTTVELQPYGTMKSFLYHAAEEVDISELLGTKIARQYTPDDHKPNCAAMAANLVAHRFSRQVPAPQCTLAGQSDQNDSLTSLYAVRTSLEEAGLYCVAVKTDIESIATFNQYGVILHYPDMQHYVVLDRIEGDDVWTVDLASRKFYWKRSVRELLRDWNDGVALLVSDSPILISGQIQFLDNTQQKQIFGGTVGYSCSDLIQITEHVLCSEPIGYLCGGAYHKFWERWGCIEDPNGGTCTGEKMVGYDYTHCINNPENPTTCTITGRWYSRYIRACK